MKIPGGDVLSFSQHCHSMSPTSYQVWIIVARGRDMKVMKVMGTLVVSLKGVNFGFWSHLGCSGQNAIIFSREGLV